METTIIIKLDDNGVKDITVEREESVERKITEKPYSQYARFFDEGCAAWQNNHEYNLMFLRNQQSYFTDLLKSKGHLFLNEVYEGLGLPKTETGQLVGWIYDVDNPIGDNFVDFGIFTNGNKEFVNGYENSILLDFNVDGNIFDKVQ